MAGTAAAEFVGFIGDADGQRSVPPIFGIGSGELTAFIGSAEQAAPAAASQGVYRALLLATLGHIKPRSLLSLSTLGHLSQGAFKSIKKRFLASNTSYKG